MASSIVSPPQSSGSPSPKPEVDANANGEVGAAPNVKGEVRDGINTVEIDKKFDEYVSTIELPNMMVSYFDRLKLTQVINQNTRCYDMLGISSDVSLNELLKTVSIVLRLLDYKELFPINKDDEQNFESARTKLIHSINTTLEPQHQLLANRVERISKFPKIRQPKGVYHDEAYQEAHQLLVNIYDVRKDPDSERHSESYQAIEEINVNIREVNDKLQLPSEYGHIPLADIIEIWEKELEDPDGEQLDELVSDYMLPKGWADMPPKDIFTEPDDIDKYWLPLRETLTPHIKTLLSELGSSSSTENLKRETARMHERLHQENKERGIPAFLYEIQIEKVFASYHELYQYFSAGESQNYERQRKFLFYACSLLGYPNTWVPEPFQQPNPASGQVSDQGSNPAPSPVPNQGSNPAPGQVSDQGSNPAPGPVPNQGSNPAPGQVSGHSSNQETSQNANAEIGRNRKRRMAVAPKKVVRSIRPGYTTTGEQIVYAKVSGTYARCVTVDSEGSYSLLKSGEAGGVAVIKSAIDYGAPQFSSIELKSLRPQIGNLGEHGIDWVAVGTWDPTRKLLPFVVLGFFHHLRGERVTEVVSRSNLKSLFGSAAEQMIAEALLPAGYDRDAASNTEEALEILYGITRAERKQHWAVKTEA